MALTPEGTPYVESTDLVANYPAASLALADRVDLVGVLPFADAAARTAAIPTPTDGQFTYLQDTNTPEFYDGSSFVPVGTPSGLVHINTTTFTTQSSVSINNVFTATYENYLMLFTGTNTNDVQIFARLRVGGVDASGSNYLAQRLLVFSSTVTASAITAQSTLPMLANNGYLGTGVYVTRPAVAAETFFSNFGNYPGATPRLDFYSGIHNLATAYDGLTISVTSGTISGTLRIYGYKNS